MQYRYLDTGLLGSRVYHHELISSFIPRVNLSLSNKVRFPYRSSEFGTSLSDSLVLALYRLLFCLLVYYFKRFPL